MLKCLLIVASLIASLCSSLDVAENANLRPRTQAPLFNAKAVMDDKFVDVSLTNYIDQHLWTVLLFYPYDYTFVCPVRILKLFSSIIL